MGKYDSTEAHIKEQLYYKTLIDVFFTNKPLIEVKALIKRNHTSSSSLRESEHPSDRVTFQDDPVNWKILMRKWQNTYGE